MYWCYTLFLLLKYSLRSYCTYSYNAREYTVYCTRNLLFRCFFTLKVFLSSGLMYIFYSFLAISAFKMQIKQHNYFVFALLSCKINRYLHSCICAIFVICYVNLPGVWFFHLWNWMKAERRIPDPWRYPTLQIILDLCIPEKELVKTRSQISFK